jgi:hypothetical protein
MMTSNSALFPAHLLRVEYQRVDDTIPYGYGALDAPEFISAGGMRAMESTTNPGRRYRVPVVAMRDMDA